ncbi:MAG TPA: hypothetical protein EYQ29_11300 [Candidatus Lambdaproteobacteria bacterium]|nr:hypothetical protein [Candidatus Lambdaproteobacteria bacterium]
MYLYQELATRAEQGNPVRVGLIGAGKFGSMFLSQVPTTPGLEVAVIADLDPARALESCKTVGWPDDLIDKTRFVDDAMAMMQTGGVDVVVEATGNPAVGLTHAREAIRVEKLTHSTSNLQVLHDSASVKKYLDGAYISIILEIRNQETILWRLSFQGVSTAATQT